MRYDCPITEDQINAIVDDELCGREQRRVAAHILSCPSCSEIAGSSLAGKRLLSARSQPVDAPAHSWEHLVTALDGADGMARATVPPRRVSSLQTVPAFALAGILLIAAAAGWHSHRGQPAGLGAMFVRNHLAACSTITRIGPDVGLHDVVTPSPGGATWVPLARWLVPLAGEFVDHTLYRVDRTPISEFIVSSHVFDRTGLTRVKGSDGVHYLMRAEAGGSVAAWEIGGLMHVLVGRTGPAELLGLAEGRRAQGPLMRSM